MAGGTLSLKLLAPPGVALDLAQSLAEELPDVLRERYPGCEWDVEVREEELAGAASAGEVDLVELARDRLREDGGDLVICLTDLPLLIGPRPETAYVSVSAGVGVVSVPALGAVSLEARVREAVLRLLDRLVGERQGRRRDRRRGGGVGARFRLRGSSVGRASEGEGRVQFLSGMLRGNLRLFLGMVRANRPWRLIAALSRALAGALGTAAFGLSSVSIWYIADGVGWGRAVLLSLAAVLATVLALMLAHRLWERVPAGVGRGRVALFNAATVTTVVLGVATLYGALLVITVLCGLALIPSGVLKSQIGHPAELSDFVRLAVIASMMGTLGGGLGSALESDRAVRQAAYGYRPNDE